MDTRVDYQGSSLGHTPAAEATTGLRYNDGKTRYDLIPADVLHEIADLYTIGAEKYAARNWEKGLVWMDTFACLLRHAFLWVRGEDYDIYPDHRGRPGSGKHHMIHVAWNAMALAAFAMRGGGTDDRPRSAFKKVN